MIFSFKKKNCSNINDHWIPFYLRCAFCNNNFQRFIGRIETFEQDVKYFLLKTNLTTEIPLQVASERMLNTATSKVISDKKLNKDGLFVASNRTMEYFKRLDKMLIKQLYELFKPDFNLFLYSIKELIE